MQLRSHYQKNKQCSELPFRSPCAKASLAQSVQGCATDRLALPFARARLAFPFAKARLAFPFAKARLAPCIVSRRGCHAKAFASDTISVVFVLCLLFECVFKGDGRFARQARVCALMRESLDILLAGDKAVRLANRLDAVLEEFAVGKPAAADEASAATKRK